MDDPERREPELPAAEAARVRRRERQRSARDRELMRTGQAKAFKQILDAQAKRAAEAGGTGKHHRRTAPAADDVVDEDASDPPASSR